ncbi:rRNA maturation RNase YbeY [Wolbachia endosymbiont of Cruorifilaria tuberocauda]|uniref:rRNA maturation RNase YbeY n=1 Tax=Wolbachia endosymbiont of Cruorifilaria tuberocauda TaxID=1812111 RepID=UPI00158C75A5|nr:rRNA maturation RNase YbeY [Wolbachia endosymbiont of Cruorifilaria tuberocauda]QKX01414.1 rRNA maturation RNase YbeY [Wolbachia endosymbiont of Cruorifilaria tuberocauda]
MLEVNVLDKRWYSITEDLEKFILNIMNVSLRKLEVDNYEPSISLVLADDNLLHQLNLRFRRVDKPTNVLSFQCEQLSNKCDLGDMAISIDTIQKESSEYNISVIAHVAHMLVHGLLHLLGYDHLEEDEEIVMKNLENRILTSLGYNIA